MARETAKGISKPKDVAEEGDTEVTTGETGKAEANLQGYTGPDGSKSLGYAKQPPVADRSGLGADADDAGRTDQPIGANSGAGPSDQAREAEAEK